MAEFDEMGVWSDADPIPAAETGGFWWGDVVQEIGRAIPVVQQLRGMFSGDENGDFGDTIPVPTGEGGMQRVALPAAAAAGGIWLAGLLARAVGSTALGAIRVAANGVRYRLTQLWPLVRKYGPVNVAGALGMSVGALGTLLVSAPPGGRRRRRRGISASDVRTTRRTIKQLRGLTRLAGLGRARPRSTYYHRHRR